MAVGIALKTESIRAEFAHKNEILSEFGEWLSPWDFYDLLFDGIAGDEKVMTVEAGATFRAMPLEKAIDYGLGRNDIYISPALFHDNYYNRDFVDKLFAVAIDIDGVTPRMLTQLVGSLQDGTYPMPTVITNSGGGLHFYYVLTEPLKTYRNTRQAARVLYDNIHEYFGAGLSATQKHWLGQPYRIVGGLTKAGDTTTAYLTGDKWTPEQLAGACSATWEVPAPIDHNGAATLKMREYAADIAAKKGIAAPDFDNFSDTYQFIKSNRGFSQTRATGEYRKSSMGWYKDTRDRVVHQTREGYRYTSLLALAAIAYKCGVSYADLESDIDMIAHLWEQEKRRWHTPFNSKNVSAALRMYKHEAIRIRRVTLENWLGWEFKGITKRNGRSREEHIDWLASLKTANSWRTLQKYLKENPAASQRQAARETGLSRNTVKKYYDMSKPKTE